MGDRPDIAIADRGYKGNQEIELEFRELLEVQERPRLKNDGG